MSFNKWRVQETFESFFGGSESQTWRDLNATQIKHYVLTSNNINELKNSLKSDAKDLYFKGLLSLSEAIQNINDHRYSWATVKLYYSIFYFLRASLYCKNIAFARYHRDLFYINLNEDLIKPKKAPVNQDHAAVIKIFTNTYSQSDILQSNNVGDKVVYQWLMEKRELVNYKDREFHDPNAPDFFTDIQEEINNIGIEGYIEKILSDQFILTFQENHAILAVPLKRLLLTREDLQVNEVDVEILESKKILIRQVLSFLQNENIVGNFV